MDVDQKDMTRDNRAIALILMVRCSARFTMSPSVDMPDMFAVRADLRHLLNGEQCAQGHIPENARYPFDKRVPVRPDCLQFCCAPWRHVLEPCTNIHVLEPCINIELQHLPWTGVFVCHFSVLA